nr:hypothetical protein [Gemmatimonadaceae bacterium]
MLRHILLVTLIALLIAPSLAAAQATEPVGTTTTGDDEVARAYDNPNVYFDALGSLMAIGNIHADAESASRAMRTFPAIFTAAIRSEAQSGFEFDEPEAVEIEQLGDESAAHRIAFSMFGSFEGEYGLLSVRQGTWVQLLIGFGVGDVDVLADIEVIAQTVLPRWPADDPVAVREDNLRTGGIWMMMPVPQDLPVGFTIDPGFEEGPAATVDTVVPVDTAPSDTEPVADPDAEATPTEPTVPTRPSPHLPIGTPEASEPDPDAVEPAPPTPEPEVGEEPEATVAPAPDAPAPATPAVISPRLATAFDVTVEIILPLARAEVADDGTCSGRGLLDGLTGGATLTLREASLGTPSVTTSIDAPGMVGYDTELRQDVCYLVATFTEVPPRAAYSLLAGESVLGRYTFDDLTAGDSVVLVLGDD